VTAASGVALSRLLAHGRLGIGNLPTPIEEVQLGAGRRILVKRDDLVGVGRGGIKARKIDFLVQHLVSKGYRSLVTVATNVTNLVHDIAPVLAELGVDYRIFVSNDPPLPRARRELLFDDLPRDKVILVGRSRVALAARTLRAAAEFRRRGERPLVLMPSLGHGSSVIGVARGFVEAVEQTEAKLGEPPRTIFITAASGVSLAGIALGERVLRDAGRRSIRIIGVSVYSGPIRTYARLLVRMAEKELGIPKLVDIDETRLTSWRDVGDFGVYEAHTAELCRRVEREHGLRIDPIYGGKTWGMMDSILRKENGHVPCLYWHCGFTPDWEQLNASC